MLPALACLVFLLAACGSPAVSLAPSASDGADADPSGAWQLVAATVDGQALPLLDDHPITAIMEPGSIGGTSACNGYGGRLDIVPGGIRIDQVGGTDMACGPNGVMALESAYLAALQRVRAMDLVDGHLVLRGNGVDLRFDRLPEVPVPDLVDTTWILETVFVGDIASPPDGEQATLEMRSDGTFSGSTGCRTFEGRWIERGAEILATDMHMNEVDCPLALSGQDSHVVSVIGDGFTPSIEGDLLTLLDPGGVGLVYRATE